MRESPPGRSESNTHIDTRHIHSTHASWSAGAGIVGFGSERSVAQVARAPPCARGCGAMTLRTACSAVCRKLLLLRCNLFMKKQCALLGNLCASITVGSACGAASTSARARAQRSCGQYRILYSKVALKVLSKAGTKLGWAWWRVQGWWRGAHGCAHRWCAVSGRARKRDPPSHR